MAEPSILGALAHRAAFVFIVAVAAAAGALGASDHVGVDVAGEDLTRLLRGMARLEAMMAPLAVAGGA